MANELNKDSTPPVSIHQDTKTDTVWISLGKGDCLVFKDALEFGKFVNTLQVQHSRLRFPKG